MIIHFLQYHFDFENMYMWADFKLRKNHAGLEYGLKPPPHIKPNLNLINFDEIRFIRGELKVWNTDKNQWVGCFIGPEPTKQITKIYIDYMFERHLLKIV